MQEQRIHTTKNLSTKKENFSTNFLKCICVYCHVICKNINGTVNGWQDGRQETNGKRNKKKNEEQELYYAEWTVFR
jgi:hypothetical protein